MHFDIADMQLFIKVAEAGSLTQGARDQARSPSAASARLKSLESQLGARLFYREPNGLTLTSAGELFLAHAKRIVAEYELTKRVFHNRSFGGDEHLRIVANAASISEIIPDALLELLNRNPEMTIDVQPKNTVQSIRSILDNEADVALVAGAGDFASVNSILFTLDYLCVVAPNGHPILSADRKNLQEIAKHPMLSISGSTLYAFMNEKFKEANTEGRYRLLLDGFEPIIRLIEANAGIAVLPESVAIRYRRKYNFCHVRVDEEWAFRERRILFGNAEFLSPGALDFIQIIIRKYLASEPDGRPLEDFLERPLKEC